VAGTILCVDDDRDLCQIIARALGEEGYDVLTAFDGDEALEVVSAESPDLVLLDLILPKRDGFAVIEAIRALEGPAAATRVIIISGCSATPEYTARAVSLEVSEFLTKPVPLTKLVESVAAIMAEIKTEVASPVRQRMTRAMTAVTGTKRLQGSLEEMPFPALLHHLHGLRATGVLHLESGKKRKWIELRDGHPVAVRSNLLNECLGHYLMRNARIQQSDLDESRRRMKGGQLQGAILVAMELLTEDEMVEALHAQADEKLFDLFSWETGKFRFAKNAELERANAIAIKRSPANLILHGVRTRFPGDRIETFFHSHADCVVAPCDSPYYRFQDIDIEPDYEALLSDLDGSRRVSEVIAGDTDLELTRALYALVATGMIELRAGDLPSKPVAVPRRVVRSRPAAPTGETERTALEAMAQRFDAQDYFEILGVDPKAKDSEIEAAYVTLAEKCHPDQYTGSSDAVHAVAEQVFEYVSRAYETLRDPRTRGVYVLDQKRDERQAEKEEIGRRAIEAGSRFQRGVALLGSRNYEEALVHFGTALELDPDEGDYHAHYGWTLHLCHPGEKPIIEEAMEHVRRGIKLASHADRAYLFMGRLFRATGKPEAAERMFARAVQLCPDSVEALRELRLINMRRERSKGLIRRLLRR
jgi:CheY-like chemotaxis protein/tetratricopeptide (TPR) repeat protein